jgi:hypothetical protein
MRRTNLKEKKKKSKISKSEEADSSKEKNLKSERKLVQN